MRCSICCTWLSAPAAVWTSDTPSWALRLAWSTPLIWPWRLSLIVRPAASSAALLMRRPEESCWVVFSSDVSVVLRLFAASIAETLVFT